MIPMYPQNMQQLQQQGMLDLGLRLLAGSGPTALPQSFGSILGQAGLGTMGAMRQAGSQMQQDQYRQAVMMQMLAKNQRAQDAANARKQTLNQLEEYRLLHTNPMDAKQQLSMDILAGTMAEGDTVPKHMYEGVLGGSGSVGKPLTDIGKLNRDLADKRITQKQYNRAVQHKYRAEGSEKVYEMKKRDLMDQGVPEETAVKLLTGAYKSVTDPIGGTVVYDATNGREVGRIQMGKGWVQSQDRDNIRDLIKR